MEPPDRAEIVWTDVGLTAAGGLVGLLPGAVVYKAAGLCPADDVACLARAFTIGGGAGFAVGGGLAGGIAHAANRGRQPGLVGVAAAGVGLLGAGLEAASLQLPPESEAGETLFLLGFSCAFLGPPIAAGGTALLVTPAPTPGGWGVAVGGRL